jgi:hypothetical protein
LSGLARGARQTFSLLPVYSGPGRATDPKPQWEGFHTKGWTKIFFCNYFDFFTSKSILKGLERLYAKNFIKIMKVEILVKIE